MMEFILMDIEGTTTSISFVHEVLFPYASTHLEAFITKHKGEAHVTAEIVAVQKTVLEEQGVELDESGAIRQLLQWIKEDRKHTALKSLQGYLWKDGYESKQYKGHIYDDVLPVWNHWQDQGIRMGIYSSGSVAAQQLLFGYSDKGDLRPYLSAYFDTKIGHKREVQSYQNIQRDLEVTAAAILFLSDIEQELDAAMEAGFQTIQVVRPGTVPSSRHRTIHSFTELV